MAVSKVKKQQSLEAMHRMIKHYPVLIITRNSGLTAAQSSVLRGALKEVSGGYVVTKNRILNIAISGTDASCMAQFLRGPVAVAYSEDCISLSKVLMKFSSENDKMEICGGVIDGQLVSYIDIKQLSELPSVDVLRAKLLNILSVPVVSLVRNMNEISARFARVLSLKS